MRISQRTIIEASAALVAVSAYALVRLDYRILREHHEKTARLLTYSADILKRDGVPMTRFDAIAIETILSE